MRKLTIVLGLALVALAGCGAEEMEPAPERTQGQRCVMLQEQVMDCVAHFCEQGTASAFCACFADSQGDLDPKGCACSLSGFWSQPRKEALCDGALPYEPRLSCERLQLEESYAGVCAGS